MIIPIKVPEDQGEGGSSSMEKIEWVMLELNGELVKPQHTAIQNNTTEAVQNGSDKKCLELGSVQFDDSVSLCICGWLSFDVAVC